MNNKNLINLKNKLSKIKLLKTITNPIYDFFEKNESPRFKYNRLKILLNTKNKKKLLALKDIHKGKQCVIMATGPSLNKVDLSLLKNHPFVFGVNGAFMAKNNLKYFFCSSPNFYDVNWQRIKKVNEELFFFSSFVGHTPIKNSVYVPINNKKQMTNFNSNLIKTRPWGPGVLLDLVIPVALWMGFSEIILLGADYTLGHYKRFHEGLKNEPGRKRQVTQEEHYQENLLAHKNFEKLKTYLSNLKKQSNKEVKIYNCSPLSHLKTFEKPDLKSVISLH